MDDTTVDELMLSLLSNPQNVIVVSDGFRRFQDSCTASKMIKTSETNPISLKDFWILGLVGERTIDSLNMILKKW